MVIWPTGVVSGSPKGFGASGEASGLSCEGLFEGESVGVGGDEQGWDGSRSAVDLVEGDIEGVAEGDAAGFRSVVGFGLDFDSGFDGGPADVGDLGDDLDSLADVNGVEEHHRVHGGGRDLASAGVPEGGDSPAFIGELEEDAAVDCAEGVGVAGLGKDRQPDPRGRRRSRFEMHCFHQRSSDIASRSLGAAVDSM